MQYQFHFLNRSGSPVQTRNPTIDSINICTNERYWQGLNLTPSRSTCQTAGRSIRRTLGRKSESLLASLDPFILYTSYIVRNYSSSRPTTSPSPTSTSPRSNRSRGTISRRSDPRIPTPQRLFSSFSPPPQLHPYSQLTTIHNALPPQPAHRRPCPLQLLTCVPSQGQEPHLPTQV